MPKTTLLDEFHLSVVVPAALCKTKVDPVLRTLRSKRFQAGLRDAVRRIFGRSPSLKVAQFSITR